MDDDRDIRHFLLEIPSEHREVPAGGSLKRQRDLDVGKRIGKEVKRELGQLVGARNGRILNELK